MVARLKEKYSEEVVPQLVDKFKIANPMAIPKLMNIKLDSTF